MPAFAKSLAAGVTMAQRVTTELTAQERVILFCAATGISHVAIGITALLRLASLCQPCIPKDRKERCVSAVRERVGSRLTIMNYEAFDQSYAATRKAAMAAFAKELAAGIAAGYALTLRLRHGDAFLRLIYSPLSSIRRIVQTRGHSCADPRPSRRLGRT
jgi:hypothetical protein